MSTLKNAAIILLGMGETCAAEVLKKLNYKDVEAIIDIMNNMEEVSEEDIIKAVNAFFKETKMLSGLDLSSQNYIRDTLISAVGNEKAGSMMSESSLISHMDGIELLKWQPLHLIIEALKNEHPQIITVAISCLDSDKAAEVLGLFPPDIKKDIIKRMTRLAPLSQIAMLTLSEYLEQQFALLSCFKVLVPDTLRGAADIISRLDVETEAEIIEYLREDNHELSEKLEDKLFPFEKLVQFDKMSIQTLLKEVDNDTLLLALKWCDEKVKAHLLANISNKAAALLEDDLESMGPMKIDDILGAQKMIIAKAKELADANKLSIPSSRKNTVSS